MVNEAEKEVDPLLKQMIKLAETDLYIWICPVQCMHVAKDGEEVTDRTDGFCIRLMAPGKGSIMEGITFEAASIIPLMQDMVTIAVGLAEVVEDRMIIPTTPPTEIEMRETVISVMKAAGLDVEMMSTPKQQPDRKHWILN